jgi:pyruvate/2-oxoglutarate dehydrogenase complex dihydrolipoamide acyltransferase (E2) component
MLLLSLLGLAQGAAAQEPPPAATPPAATTPATPPAATTPATPSSSAEPSVAAKYAEDERRRARDFARRNGYILHYQDGQYMFCREADGVTGSRVKKQRRCINREQAELERTTAREVTDKVNSGFTPQHLPGGPGG